MGYKSVGDIESDNYCKKEEQKEILRREMERYNHGHLFKINGVPEIIKNELIHKNSYQNLQWNKDDLKKKGMNGKYSLYHKFTDIHSPIFFFEKIFGGGNCVCDSKMYELGLEYVENEHGEPALRLFKERD